jgi:hypothetical protein
MTFEMNRKKTDLYLAVQRKLRGNELQIHGKYYYISSCQVTKCSNGVILFVKQNHGMVSNYCKITPD